VTKVREEGCCWRTFGEGFEADGFMVGTREHVAVELLSSSCFVPLEVLRGGVNST
jgi:hypothetical protein